jgi:hypothetical protein
MSVINKGTSFSNGEQLTAKKINDMVDLATFDQSATDSASTTVNSSSQIIVRDGGISAAKLATDSVETVKILDSTSKTDGVTLPKIQFIDTAKVLGRTTAEAGNVEELDFKTETDMASDSDTAVASQKSIKAYADAAPKAQMKVNDVAGATYAGEESITFPNGLIMKFGQATININGTAIIFATPFPNACINFSSEKIAADSSHNIGVTSVSKSQVDCNPASTGTYLWQAIGH